MAGYIGSKASVTQVDGYNTTEADAEFVNDPNDVITVDSGNVGIGTSSPDVTLEISDATSNAAKLRVARSTTQTNYLELGTSGGSSTFTAQGIAGIHGDFAFFTKPSDGSATERMRIDSSGGIRASSGSRFLASSTGVSTPDYSFASDGSMGMYRVPGSLAFATGSTERMRIDSSGNVGIGRTPSYRIDVDSNGMSAASRFNRYTDGSLRTLMIFRSSSNGSGVGSISINNNSTSYNTSSDYRLKTDAQPMTGASARVQALNPVNFEWLADGTRVDGFLAHEAQAVIPEAVTGTQDEVETWTQEEIDAGDAPANTSAGDNKLDDDGNTIPVYQGIDQSKLVPLLTAALQEALTEITDLKARVAALEAV